MNKKTILIILGVAILIILIAIIYPNAQPYSTPGWVKEIDAKIDPALCSADNCEACDKESCSYFDSCKLDYRRYACGPACDAVAVACVLNN